VVLHVWKVHLGREGRERGRKEGREGGQRQMRVILKS
jgi:hypothetical protein